MSKGNGKKVIDKTNGNIKQEKLKKRILVTLLMDATERSALRALAEHDHTSQSSWVRELIREQARALAEDLQAGGKVVPKGLEI